MNDPDFLAPDSLDPPPLAVIDIGSNSVRLVIFQMLGAFPVVLFNESLSCRLGKGLDKTGRLNPDGVKMVFDNLPRFRAVCDAMDVSHMTPLATAAVRDASDGAEFVRAAARILGTEIQILTGDQEAVTSAEGVLRGIYDADGIVCDMGGGSMELAMVEKGTVGETVTLPLGSMRLEQPGSDRRRKMQDHVARELAGVSWLDQGSGRSAYLVGGAWRALARAHMHLSGYPVKMVHNYALSAQEAREAANVMLTIESAILGAVPRMSRKRIETMPSAAIGLLGVLDHMRPRQVVFSTYGLREGRIFGHMPPNGPEHDWFLAAAADYARRTIHESLSADVLVKWAEPLFEDASRAHRRIFLGACHLSNLGWADHPEDRAYHVMNRCLRIAVPGLDHPSRAFIALALFRRYNGELSDERLSRLDGLLSVAEKNEAVTLGLVLRLAYFISAGDSRVLAATRLHRADGKLVLSVGSVAQPFFGDVVHRRLDDLAKALGLNPVLVIEGEGGRADSRPA